VALAEVPDQRAADPAEELDIERAIEPVGLANDLDIRLRRLRAGNRDREVAGQTRQQERERHHRKGDQKPECQTADDETQHAGTEVLSATAPLGSDATVSSRVHACKSRADLDESGFSYCALSP